MQIVTGRFSETHSLFRIRDRPLYKQKQPLSQQTCKKNKFLASSRTFEIESHVIKRRKFKPMPAERDEGFFTHWSLTAEKISAASKDLYFDKPLSDTPPAEETKKASPKIIRPGTPLPNQEEVMTFLTSQLQRTAFDISQPSVAKKIEAKIEPIEIKQFTSIITDWLTKPPDPSNSPPLHALKIEKIRIPIEILTDELDKWGLES